MDKVAVKLLKEYVNKQNFRSTGDIVEAMKKMHLPEKINQSIRYIHHCLV